MIQFILRRKFSKRSSVKSIARVSFANRLDEYFSKFTAQVKQYFWGGLLSKSGTLTVVRGTDRTRVERATLAALGTFIGMWMMKKGISSMRIIFKGM